MYVEWKWVGVEVYFFLRMMDELLDVGGEIVVEWSIERDICPSRVYIIFNAYRNYFASDKLLVHRGFYRGFRLL